MIRSRVVPKIVAGAAVVFPLLVGLAGQSAEASGGVGGSFVPVTPARIADTANGTGFGSSGSFAAGVTKSVSVTGVAGIPTSNVGAVVIDVSGTSSTDSRQYVYPSDESRGLASLSLGSGPASTTVVVRPGSDGKIKVYNEAGSTSLNIDVQGYFTATSTGSSTGGFVPVSPKRIVRTDTGTGISSALVGGTTYSVQVGGQNEIPANAVGVYANIRVLNATGSGGLRAVSSDLTPSSSSPSLVAYGANGQFDSGAAIDLGSDGKFKLFASTGTSADVIIDVQGYFTAGSEGGSFHPISNTRVWDSSSSPTGNIGPGSSRTITLAGNGGIPADSTAAGLALGVTVKNWTGSGSVSVVSADYDSNMGTSNVSFQGAFDGVARQSTSFVELDVDGQVTIRNLSTTSTVTVMLNAQGWFDWPEESVTLPDSYDITQVPQNIASSSASRTVTFDPVVPGAVLTSPSASQVTVSKDSEEIGTYDIRAVDANNQPIATSKNITGTTFTVTAAPTASTAYPVTISADVTLPTTEIIVGNPYGEVPGSGSESGGGGVTIYSTDPGPPRTKIKSGCKTKYFYKKYPKNADQDSLLWGFHYNVKYCWTGGYSDEVKNKKIAGSTFVTPGKIIYEVDGKWGPSNVNKVPIDYDWVDSDGKTNVYYGFRHRKCVDAVCSGWTYHKFRLTLHAGGDITQWAETKE